nr:hypothetical protein [Jannaschia seohaensis]
MEGNPFAGGAAESAAPAGAVIAWGVSSRDVTAYGPGERAALRPGETLAVGPDGGYVWTGSADQLTGRR